MSILSVIALSLTIVLPLQAVFADTATPTPTLYGEKRVEAIKNKIDKNEARGEELKARLASTTEKVEQKQEKRNDTAEKVMKKASEVATINFSRSIDQLNILVTRINTQISKFETKGDVMTTSKTALADAQTKITTASTSLASLITYIDSQKITAQNRQAVMKDIRAKSEIVKKTVKDAHNSLVKVLSAIKNEAGKNTATATTTATTTQR